jgi:hypothetical protein
MAAAEFRDLAVRKLADKSDGERVKRYDPETGDGYLADPRTWRRDDPSTWVSKPWPLAGVQIGRTGPGGRFEPKPPKRTRVGTGAVGAGRAEGWVTLENPRVVHRPGGPPGHQWRVTHTFEHGDAVVFHTTDGDVRYRIVHQPDKYVDSRSPEEKYRSVDGPEGDDDPVTEERYAAGETRVDHFYGLELEGGRA